MSNKGITKRHNLAIDFFVFLGFTILIFVVFSQTLGFGFFSDDYHMLWITKHQGSVWQYFTTNLLGTRVGHSYGPVYNLFLTAQYAVSGLYGLWYHVISITLHILATFLVYKLTFRLTKIRLLALGSGLLFSVLHAHASSLAWMAVQPHLIATVGYLAGIYLYLRFVKEEKQWQYIASLVCIAIGLFAKETVITFPAVLVLIELFFGKKKQSISDTAKRIIRRLAVPAILIVIFVALRHYATGAGAAFYGTGGLSFDLRKIAQMCIELLVNMFTNQPYRRIVTNWFLSHWWVFVAFAGVVFVAPRALKFKERKTFWFVVLSYAVVSLPFLQVGYNAVTNSGERYSYLTSAFFVIGFSVFVWGLFQKISQVRRVVYVALILCFSFYSFTLLQAELEDWSTADRLVKNVGRASHEYIGQENTYVLFAGLPDSLGGAELFRNGVLHLFLLEQNLDSIDAEIIPANMYLSKENYTSDIVTLKKSEDVDLWYLLNGVKEDTRIFTGIPGFSRDFGNSVLNRFDAPTQTATSIRFEINPMWLEEMHAAEKNVVFVYFNDGWLQGLEIETE